MNNQTKIIIVLALCLVLVFGYVAYKEISDYYLTQGYSLGQNDLIIKINNDGLIPVIDNQNVTWIPIQQLCGVEG